MIYLWQTLSPWWLAAFTLGLLVAFVAPGGESASGRGGLAAALILLAFGATAALLHIAPGRAGLWLETAVLACAAYGVGCLCGELIGAPFATTPVAARLMVGLLAAPRDSGPKASPASSPASSPAPETGGVDLSAQVDEIAPRAVEQAEAAPAPREREGGDEGPISPPPATERPDDGEGEDNLALIRGVDPTTARELHAVGVWRFSQIAAWEPEHVAWITRHFRDASGAGAKFWPPQARLLAAGALTDYARMIRNSAPGAARSNNDAPLASDDEAALAAWVASLPRPSPGGAGDGFYAGARPPGFSEPPSGEWDDLTRISGVDDERAARLNGLGVWSFGQIARWRPENTRWVGAWLATPGAPERDDWVGQARELARASE